MSIVSYRNNKEEKSRKKISDYPIITVHRVTTMFYTVTSSLS